MHGATRKNVKEKDVCCWMFFFNEKTVQMLVYINMK